MNTSYLQTISIADLIREAERAHRDAVQSLTEEDPDWAIWYANYLAKPLNGLLETELSLSDIIYCLISAELERLACSPKAEKPRYYAEHFTEHFLASEAPANDRLALYMIPQCPFCILVIKAIERLGIDVEFRDIASKPKHYQDLVNARQRATVPVLHIFSTDESTRWMPESKDIVCFLEKNYG